MSKYDPLLFGRDSEERIVGLHLQGRDAVRVYTRHDDDSVTWRDEPFKPFCFVTNDGLQVAESEVGPLFQKHRLKGDHPYCWLLTMRDWTDHWEVVKAVRDQAKNGETAYRNEVYYVASPEQQYLMQTGKTVYLGMTEADVYRVQLDIETLSSTGAFPSPERPADEIIIVTLSDNRGNGKTLRLANQKASGEYPWKDYVFDTEEELLRGLVREIQRTDPDVIELHNGFGFDLPYIRTRCERHGIPFALGRDSREPRTWASQRRFAERDIAYTNFLVAGRSVVDTMFFALAYDVFTRELPGAGLKVVAEHFREGDGITYEEMFGRPRQYVEGDAITRLWREDPDTLLTYALDDVYETRYISDKLAGATFYLAQMVPLTYQECHLAGTGKIIESIMVRQYLTKMHSLPKPEIGKQEHGGYTDLFWTGRFRNVVYADVNSLYPSIMIQYHCHPESDVLGVHRAMLTQLTALRLGVKARAGEAKEAGNKSLAAVLDARQSAYKVVINSFYGNMGYDLALFNDFSEADRVAITGQALLKKMMYHIEADFKGQVIECDTDGVLFVAPSEMHGDLEAQKRLVKQISDKMPEGIDVGMDGLFDVMISVAKKNYALRDYDGKVKKKGGTFKNRKLEPFGRDYLEKQLTHLMDNDVAAMRRLHEETLNRILLGQITLDEIAVRATLKDSLDAYFEKVEAGGTRQAQYEIADKYGVLGRRAMKGDVVRFYIGGNSRKPKAFIDGKPVELWDNDPNLFYYMDRLDSFASRFEQFFEEKPMAKEEPKTSAEQAQALKKERAKTNHFRQVFRKHRFINARSHKRVGGDPHPSQVSMFGEAEVNTAPIRIVNNHVKLRPLSTDEILEQSLPDW